MTRDSRQAYKIGQLAAATGLTVRTLHHYDHVGLVRPLARTPSGHRLYDQSDVQRLYHALALRQVGLSLEAIGHALEGTASLEDLLGQHAEYLDRQMAAVRNFGAQLTTVLTRLQDAEPASATDFSAESLARSGYWSKLHRVGAVMCLSQPNTTRGVTCWAGPPSPLLS